MKRLTKKEEIIMEHFWEKGPLFVRELRELYPEPRPHFSTLSTQVRNLQEEGFIDHKAYGPTYQYFAKVTKEEYKQRSLIGLIDKYFDNSYLSAVSALVKEEKITVEQLKELIDLVETVPAEEGNLPQVQPRGAGGNRGPVVPAAAVHHHHP